MRIAIGLLARIFIGALFGSALCHQALAEPRDSAVVSSLLLTDLQNELILGTQLSPMMATCMDDDATGGWVLPARLEREITDLAQQRKQRASEHCGTALAGVTASDIPRGTSEALHKGFAQHLQARMALEEPKRAARACLANSEDQVAFRRCVQHNGIEVADGVSWSRWLTLFARHTAQK